MNDPMSEEAVYRALAGAVDTHEKRWIREIPVGLGYAFGKISSRKRIRITVKETTYRFCWVGPPERLAGLKGCVEQSVVQRCTGYGDTLLRTTYLKGNCAAAVARHTDTSSSQNQSIAQHPKNTSQSDCATTGHILGQ